MNKRNVFRVLLTAIILISLFVSCDTNGPVCDHLYHFDADHLETSCVKCGKELKAPYMLTGDGFYREVPLTVEDGTVYVNTDSAKTFILVTNGQDIDVDAPGATIKHYSVANEVKVHDGYYVECGTNSNISYDVQPFHVTALEADAEFCIKFIEKYYNGSVDCPDFEYSENGKDWKTVDWSVASDDTSEMIRTHVTEMLKPKNIGDSIYIRAVNNDKDSLCFDNDGYTCYTQFDINYGDMAVGGNIMSLLDPAMEKNELGYYAFFDLFYDCYDLIEAKDLVLPATDLSGTWCYCCMFYECTNLKSAPEVLPSMTLSEGCYDEMFCYCYELETMPSLPATQMADYCYCWMFYDCYKLSEITIPATQLANYCFEGMLCGSGISSVTLAFDSWNDYVGPEMFDYSGTHAPASGKFYGPASLESEAATHMPSGTIPNSSPAQSYNWSFEPITD